MLYKPVFFGYIAAAVMVVAALVLILIMLTQDRQYERRKLLAIAGALAGSLVMNTLYFLSFFDQLTSLTSLYAPLERALDILCSFVINLGLFLFLYQVAREGGGHKVSRIERSFKPALAVLTCGFGFAMAVYLAVVTEEYRVSPGNLALAETAQILLTAVICAVTGVYGWLAVRASAAGLKQCIAALAAVNIATAIYNAAGSLVLFHNQYTYLRWSGAEDLNTWFFILSDGLLLLIVLWYYRQAARPKVEAAGMTGASPNSDATNLKKAAGRPADAPTETPAFAEGTTESAAGTMGPSGMISPSETIGTTNASPNNNVAAAGNSPSNLTAQLTALGLTPRETEIAQLILQRQTYREIAGQLVISEHTVKRHVHNIYEKAGVSRRDELIRMMQQTSRTR